MTIKIIRFFLLYLLFLLPYQVYEFGIDMDIFPRIDIVIIFICATLGMLQFWHLFILGIFIDYLNGSFYGMSSLILMVCQLTLKLIQLKIPYWSFNLKIGIFAFYFLIFNIFEYIIFALMSSGKVSNILIIFQYFTTIFSFALIYSIVILLINPNNEQKTN